MGCASGNSDINDFRYIMNLAYYLFWISLFVLVYTYLGYGIIVYALVRLRKRKAAPSCPSPDELPCVTMIIAAYNESHCILEKISNTLEQDYPRQKVQVFVVTDGSTDDTPDKARHFDWIRLFHQPERRGKIHAVNRVMKEVNTPFVIFSDANTLLNRQALKNLMRHYQDPRVGGVSGEKQIVKKTKDNAPGSGEGLYWKYESFLKKMDSELYSVVGAAGELFSVRTSLYEPPPENMIIEDFYISMRIVARGFRFVYEPHALARETASASIRDEWKRKVRIAAGGLQAIVRLSPLLNVLRYGIVSFEYLSHRVLRWTLAPACILIALVSNVYLVAFYNIIVYNFFMGCQLAFYGLGAAGYLCRNRQISIKGFFVPFYFIVMNVSVFVGFLRLVLGKQSVIWEKTRRAVS